MVSIFFSHVKLSMMKHSFFLKQSSSSMILHKGTAMYLMKGKDIFDM